MPEQINQTVSFHARGIGLQVIAALQIVAATALAIVLILDLWEIWDPRDPLLSLLTALALVSLAILLLIMGWGLWKRRAWARLLALIVYWMTFAGAILLLLLVPGIVFLNPPTGDGAGFVYLAVVFLVLCLLPVLLISAWTVWYLHRRTFR